ncbi:MAG: Gfo/Idh/MocA family protein [Spirochaetota bacterium]
MKDVGIGVVGLGRLGYVHAVNVSRSHRGKLVAVCDQREDLAAAVSSELGCSAYHDLHTMLDKQKDIDALIIVTPTDTHVAPVTAACEAGLPMFCEKPLASTLEDTVQLSDLIKATGTICQIGFHRRFDPPISEAKQMIDDGVIGKPVYISGVTRDPFPPPPWACDPDKGGGLYIDLLLHDFDTARFLMGEEVNSIFAADANLVVDPQGVKRFADNASVTMNFSSGALGAFHASIHASYGYDVRTEVFGAEGSIQMGTVSKSGLTLSRPGAGVCHPSTYLSEQNGKIPHFMGRFKEAYELELEGFLNCVIEKRSPLANEDDALAAYRISLAAARSSTNHAPVLIRDID